MTLVLLPNNIVQDTARIYTTDAADVELSDTAGLVSITGGARNLFYTSSTTGARRIVYVNKLGGLDCTHVILTNANIHGSKAIDLISWSTYAGSPTTEFSTGSFAETLVGKNTTDWVYPLSLSNKQGIGISFASSGYTKLVYKFYVSNGLTLNYPGPCTYRWLPFPNRHVYQRQMYLVDAEWSFLFDNMTRAEINAFETIPSLLSEPLFLYDSTGYHFRQKLIHGIISDYKVTVIHDNICQLGVTVKELRQWD